MGKIPVGIVGVGNCASSLLQGIEFYRSGDHEPIGLMHHVVGGYRPGDIEVVCAFDVDRRKVGATLDVAALAPPNNARPLLPEAAALVGRRRDGTGARRRLRAHGGLPRGAHVRGRRAPPGRRRRGAAAERRRGGRSTTCRSAASTPPSTTRAPASRPASRFVNCIPVFIASDPQWAAEFERRRIPIVGDDVKSQLGATIVHRALAQLFADRGVTLDRTYQLNIGGNTDFLNMLNHDAHGVEAHLEDRGRAERAAARAGRRSRSTSARATTWPGSGTTRSASCAWRDAGFGNAPHRARAASLGPGQPELRGVRHRRHPLLPRRARPWRRRPARQRVVLSA